jgi:hypothetical protein
MRSLHDCGRPITIPRSWRPAPRRARPGIGTALGEALLYDEAGQLLTGTFMDYPLPRADELPAFDVTHMDFPSSVNPLGIKGVGESGVIAPRRRHRQRGGGCARRLRRPDRSGSAHAGASPRAPAKSLIESGPCGAG